MAYTEGQSISKANFLKGIMKNCVDKSPICNAGKTPLHFAAQGGNLATFKEVSLVMNRIIVCKSNSKATTTDLDSYRQTTIFHAYNYRF